MYIDGHEPWQDRLVDHHDYIWARLPFVIPMALAVARRRRDPRSHALARDLVALRPVVLDHLAREEQALALRSAHTICDRLHADHVALGNMLAHLRDDAADASSGREQEATERRLFTELARLYLHLEDQIALEERMLYMQ